MKTDEVIARKKKRKKNKRLKKKKKKATVKIGPSDENSKIFQNR